MEAIIEEIVTIAVKREISSNIENIAEATVNKIQGFKRERDEIVKKERSLIEKQQQLEQREQQLESQQASLKKKLKLANDVCACAR